MAVNRLLILEDVKFNLPPQNTLTDDQMLIIIDKIILVVGSADENYAEIFCKSLKAIAEKNYRDSLVQSSSVGNKRREKTDEVEVEWFDSPGDTSGGWKAFIDEVPTICAENGFTLKKPLGIKLSTGKKVDYCGCSTIINKE